MGFAFCSRNIVSRHAIRWGLCLFCVSVAYSANAGFRTECQALLTSSARAVALRKQALREFYFSTLESKSLREFDWDRYEAALAQLKEGFSTRIDSDRIEDQYAYLAHFLDRSPNEITDGLRSSDLLRSESAEVRYKAAKLLRGTKLDAFQILHDTFSGSLQIGRTFDSAASTFQMERLVNDLFLVNRLQDRIDLLDRLVPQAKSELRDRTALYLKKKMLTHGLYAAIQEIDPQIGTSVRERIQRIVSSEAFSAVFSVASNLQIAQGIVGVLPKIDWVRLTPARTREMFEQGMNRAWKDDFWDEAVQHYQGRIKRQEAYSAFSKAYAYVGLAVVSYVVYTEVRESKAAAEKRGDDEASELIANLEAENQHLDDEIRKARGRAELSPGERLFEKWKDAYREEHGKEASVSDEEYLSARHLFLGK